MVKVYILGMKLAHVEMFIFYVVNSFNFSIIDLCIDTYVYNCPKLCLVLRIDVYLSSVLCQNNYLL